MVAKSFSISALILLLLVSISSGARIVSYYENPHIDTTSTVRFPKPAKTTTKPPAKPPKGEEPDFSVISADKVKAVWRANAVLSKGTKPSSSLNSLPGWNQIKKDVVAAGGTAPGPTGGKSDIARCHMIGDALGGKATKKNLFSCFAYFNSPGMFHFERLLKAKIQRLKGKQKCEMTVTVLFSTKEYPSSVNMNAKCQGKQFFDVNITNEFPGTNVKIEHLCRPTIPLQPGSFDGTSSVASTASAC